MPKFSPFAAATGAMLESNQDLFYNIVIRGKFMDVFFLFAEIGLLCDFMVTSKCQKMEKMAKNGIFQL